jgi:hypothetical protein
MVITYKANKAAIGEYARVEGVTLNYGVFAATKTGLGSNDIFNCDNAVVAEVDAMYSFFDFKLTGFTTDVQKTALIALGAYVIDSNENVTYIQAGTPEANEKYFFVSFNDVEKQTN